MLLAVAFFVAPDVAATSDAARTTTRPRATMLRLFIWIPLQSGGPVAHCESRRRTFGTDHFSFREMLSQSGYRCQYHFRISGSRRPERSRVVARAGRRRRAP